MRLIYALSIVFALGVTSAHADGYTPQAVPPCTLFQTPAGEVCGYLNIEDWKLVLKADAELVHLRVRVKNDSDRAVVLDLQIAEMHRQNSIYAGSQTILLERNTTLSKQLLDLDLKYQQERVKPAWGSTLAWSVAGVSLAMLVCVIVGGF